MIDYLCLKLGWSSEQVLNNPHFDNQRKLDVYMAMDEISKRWPIYAIPVLDDNLLESIRGEVLQAMDRLREAIGLQSMRAGPKLTEKDHAMMQAILRSAVGEELVSIEDFIPKKKPEPID